MLKNVGLQFFAEDITDGAASEAGAAEDAVLDSSMEADFEAAFDGEGADGSENPAEDNPPEGQTGAEGGAGGDGSQEDRTEEDPSTTSGGPPPLSGEASPAGESPVMTVDVGGMMVPADAMQALSQALGQDASQLIQRGMSYEHKAAREISILEDYARSAGMELSAYLDQLEQQRDEFMISNEIEAIRSRFPEGTPDEALREIAANTVNTRKAQERAAQAMQQRAAAEQQEQARSQSMRQEIMQFRAAHPEFANAKDVPQEVWDTIQNSGGKIGLSAAYTMYERDQARAEVETLREQMQAMQKNNENRQASPGSMSGAVDDGGFMSDFINAFDKKGC